MSSRRGGYRQQLEGKDDISDFLAHLQEIRAIAIAGLVFGLIAFVAGAIALGFGSSYINTHFYGPSPAPTPTPPPAPPSISTNVTYIEAISSATGNVSLVLTSLGSARIVSLYGEISFVPFIYDGIYFDVGTLDALDLPYIDPNNSVSSYPACLVSQLDTPQAYLFYMYVGSDGSLLLFSSAVNALNYAPSPTVGFVTGIGSLLAVDQFFTEGNLNYTGFTVNNPWYLECHVTWHTAAAFGVASSSFRGSSARGGWPFNRTRGGGKR
jgi:hypothetical protein